MSRSTRVMRVLVLDASASRRARLHRLVDGDALLHVAASASTAEQAMRLNEQAHADVLLVGHPATASHAVEWTRQIMETAPRPVVVVCGTAAHAEAPFAAEFIQAGAVAVVPDPAAFTGAEAADATAALRRSLRTMAEVKVVRRWSRRPRDTGAGAGAGAGGAGGVADAAGAAGLAARATPAAVARQARPASLTALPQARGRRIDVVAIGASTGGPAVLKQVLSALPADFPAPILIVQHMANGFVRVVTDWLASTCAIEVEIAVPGKELQPGHAYFAQDDAHMRLGMNGVLAFDRAEPVNGHRPAVSVLFASVAERCGPHAVAVLLTGMGKDGAAEMKQLRDLGAITIAQDQASSAVHGMPGEAIRNGGASYIMSPAEIASVLSQLVKKEGDTQ